MASHDPIPAANDTFDTLQKTVVDKTTANKVAWGIPDGEISLLLPFQTDWNNTYPPTKDRKNTTTQQRKARDLARKNYTPKLRRFIKVWIYANDNMTDDDIVLCGLNPHDRIRTPVGLPATLPQVDTKPETGHLVKVFFRQEPDENGISKRGKPEGVGFIEFVLNIGGTPPASPEQCTQRKTATRSPIRAQFDATQKGQTVYFFARWLNKNGEGADRWTERGEFIVP